MNDRGAVEQVSLRHLPYFKNRELQLPQIKEQIIEMSLNGSGIRDIARVLKISPTTVIEEIKKRNRAECCKYRFAAPA
jgi:transposase-like protein